MELNETAVCNGISKLIPYLDFKVKMRGGLFKDPILTIMIMKSPVFIPRFTPYLISNIEIRRTFTSEFETVTHQLLRKYSLNMYVNRNDVKIALSYRYKTDADYDERYIMFKLARGL